MDTKNVENWAEVGQLLGNLTPYQVLNLAYLGQNVLKVMGTAAASDLIEVGTNGLIDEAPNRGQYITAIQIGRAIAETSHLAVLDGATLKEFTGVNIDNEIYKNGEE